MWHSQLPRWFCTDSEGKNVSPEVLKQRMKDHIYTVVGRYKGRVKGWDVVNEAIIEDGSYRKTKSWVKSLFLWLFNMPMKRTRMPNFITMITA